MALAYGFGAAHVGFGLGFLNFLGTVLFFILLFMLFKTLFRGWRYAGSKGWRGGTGPWGWSRHGWHGHKDRPARAEEDEAMNTARERLAQGEITPEEFEALKQGLRSGRPENGDGYGGYQRFDRAIDLARMRFARGEISAEEFEAVRKTLLD